MRQRCRDANRKDSKHYALKGITVCERWMSFENFLEDMGSGWKPGLTLHRIDNNKGYEPGNVEWATWKKQNTNSGHARVIALGDVSKTITDWCESFGIQRHTFYNRLARGWSIESALRNR